MDFVTAYLDDVVLVGDATAVFQSLPVLQQAAPDIGFELNLKNALNYKRYPKKISSLIYI